MRYLLIAISVLVLSACKKVETINDVKVTNPVPDYNVQTPAGKWHVTQLPGLPEEYTLAEIFENNFGRYFYIKDKQGKYRLLKMNGMELNNIAQFKPNSSYLFLYNVWYGIDEDGIPICTYWITNSIGDSQTILLKYNNPTTEPDTVILSVGSDIKSAFPFTIGSSLYLLEVNVDNNIPKELFLSKYTNNQKQLIGQLDISAEQLKWHNILFKQQNNFYTATYYGAPDINLPKKSITYKLSENGIEPIFTWQNTEEINVYDEIVFNNQLFYLQTDKKPQSQRLYKLINNSNGNVIYSDTISLSNLSVINNSLFFVKSTGQTAADCVFELIEYKDKILYRYPVDVSTFADLRTVYTNYNQFTGVRVRSAVFPFKIDEQIYMHFTYGASGLSSKNIIVRFQ